MWKLYLICLGLVTIKSDVQAQKDTTILYKGMQANLHYGFIIAHSKEIQNTAGSRPRGVEIEFLKQRADTASWNVCNCFPATGWSISYFDIDNAVLGNAITVAYFLEPSYRISKRTQFRFKGRIGLSYLTNPHHPVHNAANMSYSTHLNGYAQVGLHASYQLADQWVFLMGAQYHHVSNGGLKDPNKGINWTTASVGVTWFQQRYRLPVYYKTANKDYRQQKPHVEAGAFFSAKQGHQPNGGSARTPLVGVLVQVTKQVGRINALNSGVEIYYDNALKQQLKEDSVKGSALRAGLLAGHEFLLGRFFFSQQLGVYLINRNPYYDRIYHRWALRYQVNKNWIAGVGFNAHKHVADFIDMRLMFRF